MEAISWWHLPLNYRIETNSSRLVVSSLTLCIISVSSSTLACSRLPLELRVDFYHRQEVIVLVTWVTVVTTIVLLIEVNSSSTHNAAIPDCHECHPKQTLILRIQGMLPVVSNTVTLCYYIYHSYRMVKRSSCHIDSSLIYCIRALSPRPTVVNTPISHVALQSQYSSFCW